MPVRIRAKAGRRTRTPRKTSASGLAVTIAKGLGDEVESRVRVRGRPAEPFTGYTRSVRSVIAGYAGMRAPKVPGRKDLGHGSYVMRFASSQAFHDAAPKHRRGNFQVGGGMWAGRQTKGRGKFGAIVRFYKRSVGQGVATAGTPGEPAYSGSGGPVLNRWVGNAKKAETVLAKNRVNVLQPIRQEWDALGDAATEAVQRMLDKTFPIKPTWKRGRTAKRLVRRLLRGFKG